MNFNRILPFIIKNKKRIAVSLLALASAVMSVLFYLLGAAAMGSGLSNASDTTSVAYSFGKIFTVILAMMIFIIPATTLIGLFLYWRGWQNRLCYGLVFSGFYSVVLYFLLANIGVLLYFGISNAFSI